MTIIDVDASVGPGGSHGELLADYDALVDTLDRGPQVKRNRRRAARRFLSRWPDVGFRRFTHYRIRALLYAGRPDWDLLAGVTPR